MIETIVLPDKLPSSATGDLLGLLGDPRADALCIDARHVRAMGARAAEILIRFKTVTEAVGGTVTILLSADLADDLRILGLSDHLITKDISQ